MSNSKIFDVENMYGQDFNIVTTNAPTNIIKNQNTKLLSNTLLISSPSDNNEYDNNMPSMFVTDYTGQPLQLTYAFKTGNGLSCSDDSSYLYINIDNKTIKTDGNGALNVDTNNLIKASPNDLGVVMINGDMSINRNLEKKYSDNNTNVKDFNNKTFINIDSRGTLYLDNNFFDLIDSIVNMRVKKKINNLKVLMNVNLKMWIVITQIDDNPNTVAKKYNVGSLDTVKLDNNKMTKVKFELHYFSFSSGSENVKIEDESNKLYSYPNNPEGYNTSVFNVPDNDELYEHVIDNPNFIFEFLPNYFIVNNTSYDQSLNVIFKINGDNKLGIPFVQDKFQFITNEMFKNFYIETYGQNPDSNSKYIYIDELERKDNVDNQNIGFINYVITNKNIFEDIIYNSNDNVIQYTLKTYVNNNFNDNHYLLDTKPITFVNVNDNGILNESIYPQINETPTKLYEFIFGQDIYEKDSIITKYVDENNNNTVKYKINDDISINIGDDITVPVKNFVEPLETYKENGQIDKIIQTINILTEFIVKDNRGHELGIYSTKTPIELKLEPRNQ